MIILVLISQKTAAEYTRLDLYCADYSSKVAKVARWLKNLMRRENGMLDGKIN
jgi:hypothetical protein